MLVLLADHEVNASTFTVRCAASTGLNLYDAMIAGLVALKGPRHGGAGVLAAQLVKTLVEGDVAPVIRERVALGERFAGFGHGVYKHGDPRAHALLDALTRAGAAQKLTREIPDRIAEATGEFVNIDYALAVLVHTLGLSPGNELVLFAMARTVGWIAHASEQLRHGGLIRPRARYIGPAPGRSPRRPVMMAGDACGGRSSRPPRQPARRRSPSVSSNACRSRCDAECRHIRAADTASTPGSTWTAAHSRIAGMLTASQRRHAERARRDRHEGAYRRYEAREEHRERAPAMKERLALRDQARIIRQRPGAQDAGAGRDGRSRTPCHRRASRLISRPPAPARAAFAAGHQRAQRQDDGGPE